MDMLIVVCLPTVPVGQQSQLNEPIGWSDVYDDVQ